MLGSQDIFTIGEVARLTSVSEKTVRGAMRAGDLEALRFNARLVRIRRDAVERWLDICTARARYRVVRGAGTGGTGTSSRSGHKSA